MLAYLWVAIGGALGSVGRFWLNGLISATRFGETFPLGTLVINVAGSFVIGLFATLTLPHGPLPVSVGARAFVMAGICGGYTTFSAFSLQTWDLMRAGDWLAACGNVAGSVVLCLVAVIAGHWLALRIGAG